MIIRIVVAFVIILQSASLLAAEAAQSLSTSNMIAVDKIPQGSSEPVVACSGEVAVGSRSYVSIEVTKLRVRKADGLLKRIFNANRLAFPAANLEGQNLGKPIAVSRIGTPKVLRRSDSVVDLAATWDILEKTPWTIENAKFTVRIGYSADSTINSLVTAFEEITSAIPDYTVSTGVSIGLKVATTVDNLLFKSERVTDLLHSERDFPLSSGTLCDGYYVVYAAESANDYDEYENGDVVYNENSQEIQYLGKEPNDISYGVLKIGVHDRFFEDASDALNDPNKLWAAKYREAQTDLSRLIWATTREEVDTIGRQIQEKVIEARTFLDADLGLIQIERREIHKHVVNDALPKIEAVRDRIASSGAVTKESTEAAVAAFSKAARDGSTDISPIISKAPWVHPRILQMNESLTDKESKELAISIEASLKDIELVF